jgi:hypothetical protein
MSNNLNNINLKKSQKMELIALAQHIVLQESSIIFHDVSTSFNGGKIDQYSILKKEKLLDKNFGIIEPVFRVSRFEDFDMFGGTEISLILPPFNKLMVRDFEDIHAGALKQDFVELRKLYNLAKEKHERLNPAKPIETLDIYKVIQKLKIFTK